MVNLSLVASLVSFAAEPPGADAAKTEVFVAQRSRGESQAVLFAPNGRYFAEVADDLKVWDLSSGLQLRTFALGGRARLADARFSKDSSQITITNKIHNQKTWDLASGKCIREASPVHADNPEILLGEDTSLEVISTWNGVVVSNLSTGTSTGLELSPDPGTHSALAIHESADGKALVVLLDGEHAEVFDLRTVKKIRDLVLQHCLDIRANTDARTLVTLNCVSDEKYQGFEPDKQADNSLSFWNTNDGRKTRQIDGILGMFAMAPDGRSVAYRSDSRTVVVADATTGEQRFSISRDKALQILEFSPDSRFIVCRQDEKVFLVDTASGAPAGSLEAGDSYAGLSLDSRLAALRDKGTDHIRIVSVEGQTPPLDLQDGISVMPAAANSIFDLSPDGSLVASASGGIVCLWNVATAKVIGTLKPDLLDENSNIDSLAFSPDGKTLAIAHFEIELWDVSSQTRRGIMALENSAQEKLRAVAYSPDGRLISAVEKNSIVVCNVASMREIYYLAGGHSDPPDTTSFSRDGKLLASNSRKEVVIWDTATGRLLNRFPWHSYEGAVCFSPRDDTLALSGNEGRAVLYNPTTGDRLESFNEVDGVYNLQANFSPNGRLLAIGNSAASISIWDLDTDSEVGRIEGVNPLVGRPCISPDSRFLLAPTRDGAVGLWRIADGSRLESLYSVKGGDWIALRDDNLYQCSSTLAESFLNVRTGSTVGKVASLGQAYNHPESFISAFNELRALNLRAPEPKLIPPTVNMIDPRPSAPGADVDLSLSVSDNGGGIGNVTLLFAGVPVAHGKPETFGLSEGPMCDLGKIAIDSVNRSFHFSIFNAPKFSYEVTLDPGDLPDQDIEFVAYNRLNNRCRVVARKTLKSGFPVVPGHRLYALLFGAGKFHDPKDDRPAIPMAATRLANLLKTRARGAFAQVDVDLLTTVEETSRASLLSTLSAAANLSPDDVFFLYLGTHGGNMKTRKESDAEKLSKENDKEGFIILTSGPGTPPGSPVTWRNSIVFATELRDRIARIPARKKVIIVETCVADGVAALIEELGRTMVAENSGRDTCMSVIAACPANKFTGGSYFIDRFLEGLGGAADTDRTGVVNTTKIVAYMAQAKGWDGAQFPTFNYGEPIDLITNPIR